MSTMNILQDIVPISQRLKPSNLQSSMQLVWIACQLGDPSFGIFHCRLAFAFNIFAFCNIGRYSTSSQNCLETRRLLLFIDDLILLFKVHRARTLGEDDAFCQLIEWIRRYPFHRLFIISTYLLLFTQRCPCIVSMSKYMKIQVFS